MEKAYRNVSGLFIIILLGAFWGFYKPYTLLFPNFNGYTYIHHIHGVLMISWMLLLIVQPILIRTGRNPLHRTVGKASYVIAPVIMIFIFLASRTGYNRDLGLFPKEDMLATMAIICWQIRGYVLLNKRIDAKKS